MELKDIKELIKSLDESSVAKLEFVQGEYAITLEKEKTEPVVMMPQPTHPVTPVISAPVEVNQPVLEASTEAAVTKEQVSSTTSVLAPLVGVFYQAASPESEPFVKVGQAVHAGDTICILEAMKVLNEIKAPASGVVKEIHVSNGDVVEFDQLLMEIGD